ncbi:GDSL esterase/lipase [Populus alba x Populus x berolinensis]|nr:GDSL esterase/lipase [Populus alba x Populus x berolinensis]
MACRYKPKMFWGILTGVNYASAASGIRNETGQNLTLYDYGARKVTTLFGITPIGCAPAILAAAGTNVQLFNTELRSLVDGLNNNLTGANFIYVNTYQIYSTSSSGFRVRNAPWCPASPITAPCIPSSNPRGSGSEYTWWDAIHPSGTSNIITATGSSNSQSPFDAYPMDIRRLARSASSSFKKTYVEPRWAIETAETFSRREFRRLQGKNTCKQSHFPLNVVSAT